MLSDEEVFSDCDIAAASSSTGATCAGPVPLSKGRDVLVLILGSVGDQDPTLRLRVFEQARFFEFLSHVIVTSDNP